MDTARYVVGCLLVVGVPPAIGWWLLIHPFVAFWRRVGVRGTFTVVGVVSLIGVYLLYRVRDVLLMSDLGTSWSMVGVALVFLVVTIWIALKRRKQLTMRILAGTPELHESGRGGALLTDGAYAVVRNPRYVEVVFGVFAYAAFSNHVGAYLVAAVTVPAIHLVVLLEERELRARFGREYEAYCAAVPRYVPRAGSLRRRG